MIILSFDVGVKNLALCLLHINNVNEIDALEIKDWDVIDLSCDDNISKNTLKCNQFIKNKACPRPAKFTYKNDYFKAKPKKKVAGSSVSYAKNVPLLIITGIFLFFVLYYLLKAKKSDEERLKRKIDAEIRKKLYYTDDYY